MKTQPPQPAPSSRWQSLFLGGVIVLGAATVLYVALFMRPPQGAPIRASGSAIQGDHDSQDGAQNGAQDGAQQVGYQQPAGPPPVNPLDGDRAMEYLKQVCTIGTRIAGTEGMTKQQELLTKHFEALGGKVTLQKFTGRHPISGQQVPLANMIVEWHPEKTERVLLSCHYDTRPLPSEDPNPELARNGTFIGANDGASGVAVMMELAHLMGGLDSRFGVDFVLFDAEELVYRPNDPFFLGSIYFSQQYLTNRPAYHYRWGVLMDMVGDADLQIYYEQNSVSWPETRPLVQEIWTTAQRLGVREFIPQMGHNVRDDHLQLRNIAGIPSCDLIDFDYGPRDNMYWHTTRDVPENCSGASLAKVGWVLYEWIAQNK